MIEGPTNNESPSFQSAVNTSNDLDRWTSDAERVRKSRLGARERQAKLTEIGTEALRIAKKDSAWAVDPGKPSSGGALGLKFRIQQLQKMSKELQKLASKSKKLGLVGSPKQSVLQAKQEIDGKIQALEQHLKTAVLQTSQRREEVEAKINHLIPLIDKGIQDVLSGKDMRDPLITKTAIRVMAAHRAFDKLPASHPLSAEMGQLENWTSLSATASMRDELERQSTSEKVEFSFSEEEKGALQTCKRQLEFAFRMSCVMPGLLSRTSWPGLGLATEQLIPQLQQLQDNVSGLLQAFPETQREQVLQVALSEPVLKSSFTKLSVINRDAHLINWNSQVQKALQGSYERTEPVLEKSQSALVEALTKFADCAISCFQLEELDSLHLMGIEAATDEIMKQIALCASSESSEGFIWPGGVNDHLMLYKVEFNSEDADYTFSIINTGEGVFLHGIEDEDVEEGIRAQTHLKFTGIKLEDLDRGFIKDLVSYVSDQTLGQKGVDVLYQRCQEQLGDPFEYEGGFHQIQQRNFCSQKAIQAWLHEQLGGNGMEETYKKIKANMSAYTEELFSLVISEQTGEEIQTDGFSTVELGMMLAASGRGKAVEEAGAKGLKNPIQDLDEALLQELRTVTAHRRAKVNDK